MDYQKAYEELKKKHSDLKKDYEERYDRTQEGLDYKYFICYACGKVGTAGSISYCEECNKSFCDNCFEGEHLLKNSKYHGCCFSCCTDNHYCEICKIQPWHLKQLCDELFVTKNNDNVEIFCDKCFVNLINTLTGINKDITLTIIKQYLVET